METSQIGFAQVVNYVVVVPINSRAGEIPQKIHNTLSKWSLYLVMAMQTNKSENKSWQAVSVWISIFLRGTSTV